MTVARKPGHRLGGDAVVQKAHEEAAAPHTKPATSPAASSCVFSKPAEESPQTAAWAVNLPTSLSTRSKLILLHDAVAQRVPG